MTSAGPSQPAGSPSQAPGSPDPAAVPRDAPTPPAGSPAAPGVNRPPVQRPLVSPLLRAGYGVDEGTRARLIYSVGNRQAVLVELNLSTGASADEIRGHFIDVFRAAFERESEQPPEPRPISSHYMRCLLTQDEITMLADQDAVPRPGLAQWR